MCYREKKYSKKQSVNQSISQSVNQSDGSQLATTIVTFDCLNKNISCLNKANELRKLQKYLPLKQNCKVDNKLTQNIKKPY